MKRHPKSEILSEYMDGDLSLREAEELEAHLAECAGCSALLRELEKVRVRAKTLPDRFPTRDLWPGIERGIRQGEAGDPQVIRLHPSAATPSPAREERGFRLSYVQAAAAGLVLALFSGALGGLLFAGSRPPVPDAVATAAPWAELVRLAGPDLGETAREAARLEDLLAGYGSELDPNTARILENNLGVIDQAIRESVRALEADPGNAFLKNHLARSVEAKANYLKEATAFVAPVS
ncbi:MAG: anti-sigma factor family protein [Longimicrobiales bacterium]